MNDLLIKVQYIYKNKIKTLKKTKMRVIFFST